MNERTVFPGWYEDPSNPRMQRWWDGRQWTDRTQMPPPQSTVPPPQPVAPSHAATDYAEPRSNVPLVGAGVGLGLIVLGCLLPWATFTSVFGSFSISGTETSDGKLILVLAGAGLLGIVLAATDRPRMISLSIGCAVIATLVAIYDMTDIAQIAGEDIAIVQVGIGLWLVVIGGVVAVAGGVQHWRSA